MSKLRNIARRLSHGTTARTAAAFAGAVAAGLAVACADTPTSPAKPGAAAFGRTTTASVTSTSTTTSTTGTTAAPTGTKVKALLRTTPLAGSLLKSWTVAKADTTLEWPEVGLKVSVPAAAIPTGGMTITVKALKGDVIAYDFGPDGSRFAEALTVMQSLTGTNFGQVSDYTQVRGGYFKSSTQIDNATKSAAVDEFEPTEVDLNTSTVRFKVSHFSGYLVSWGAF